MKLNTLFTKAKTSESSIKSRVLSMDILFATETLKNFNDSNRPMSTGLIKLYANEMLRGQWKCNGEPIIFSVDSDGKEHLISGQHRLAALLKANSDVLGGQIWDTAQLKWDAVVIYGVDHNTADTVDTGKTRNHADVLFRDAWIDDVIPESWNETIAKRKLWTRTLAGAARLVWLIEGGATVSSAPKFLISEMLMFVQIKHPGIADFVSMVLDANADSDSSGLKMSLPYTAALCYLGCIQDNNGTIEISEELTDKFDEFINQLAVGTGYAKGDPVWALTGYWNKLTGEAGSKDRDRDWVGPFIKAANLMLEGKTGVKISDIPLSAKEKNNYTDFPVMYPGYMTDCFENAASIKANAKAAKEAEKNVEKAEGEVAIDIDEQPTQEFAPPTKPTIKRRPRKPAATEVA